MTHIADSKATNSFSIPDHNSIDKKPISLSLRECIAFTLYKNPNIKLSQQSLDVAKANIQIAKSTFDSHLLLDFSQQFNQDELSPAELAFQKGQRTRERLFYQTFGRIADDLFAKLASGDGRLQEQTIEEEYQATIDEMFYETMIENADSEQEAAQYQALSNNQITTNREIFEDIAKNLRQQSLAARDRLIALGSTPYIVQNKPTLFDISYSQTWRNGITFTPRMLFTISDRNYRNKPYDPARGGTGKAPEYRSIWGFSVDVPLAKGSGIESVTAMERAAKVDKEAVSDGVKHTIEESLLATIQAYWNVVANQERLKIFVHSARLNEKLVNLAKALIKIDQLPRTVLPYVLARRAQAWAKHSEANIELKNALGELLLNMGVSPEQIPLDFENTKNVGFTNFIAADEFPEVLSEQQFTTLNIEELIGSAIVKRHDLRAVKNQEKSARILLGAARADTRKDMNVQLLFAASSNKRSLSFKDGVKGAFGGPFLGPSVQLLFNMDFPFQNQTAQGKVTSAYANWQEKVINSKNLLRSVKNKVMKVFLNLSYARESVEQSLMAVKEYQNNLDSSLQRFNLGQSTVIDTILSEERLTDARLLKIENYRNYALAYVSFLFESGQLMDNYNPTNAFHNSAENRIQSMSKKDYN